MKNLPKKIATIRSRRTRCTEMRAVLDRTGKEQISLTDADSRAMAAHTRVAVSYNVQVAVDTKHELIVEQKVTNQVVDMIADLDGCTGRGSSRRGDTRRGGRQRLFQD